MLIFEFLPTPIFGVPGAFFTKGITKKPWICPKNLTFFRIFSIDIEKFFSYNIFG